MSIDQGNPGPGGYPTGPTPYAPGPYGPAQPEQRGNAFAVTGFIFAFLCAPVGFVLSVIGAAVSGKRGKGRGLSIAGIVISLIIMIVVGGVVIYAARTVTKLTDAGCVTGKAAVNDNSAKVASSDPQTSAAGMQATIDGLHKAAAQTKRPEVRTALTAAAADFTTQLQDNQAGKPEDLTTKINADIDGLNRVCTLGGK